MGALPYGRYDGSGVRCAKCKKLIAKSSPEGHLEIKCSRCGELNGALGQMQEQVIITSLDGKVLYINKATQQATGYTELEAIGKTPGELWGGQMSQEFYHDMWRHIKDKKTKFHARMTNVTKSGKLYNVEMIIYPILDKEGLLLFYVATEVLKKNT